MNVSVVEEKVVIFTVGDQEYSVPIHRVKEVVPWTKPTPVLVRPKFVEGVIDLRGDVIPVIHLSSRLGVPNVIADSDCRVMVVEIGRYQVGLWVDSVTEIHTIGTTQRNDFTSLLVLGGRDPVVSGILKVPVGRLVVMIDLDRILTNGSLDSIQTGRVQIGGQQSD